LRSRNIFINDCLTFSAIDGIQIDFRAGFITQDCAASKSIKNPTSTVINQKFRFPAPALTHALPVRANIICLYLCCAMHIALENLQLEHLWVVYPGTRRYPITEKINTLPLREIHQTELKSTT